MVFVLGTEGTACAASTAARPLWLVLYARTWVYNTCTNCNEPAEDIRSGRLELVWCFFRVVWLCQWRSERCATSFADVGSGPVAVAIVIDTPLGESLSG